MGEGEVMHQVCSWCPLNALLVAEVHLPSMSLVWDPMKSSTDHRMGRLGCVFR